MSDVKPKPVVGRYLPETVAEAIYTYLMTRPCNETINLVVALTQAKQLTREPK